LLVVFAAYFVALLTQISRILANDGGYVAAADGLNTTPKGIDSVYAILLGLTFSTLFSVWFWMKTMLGLLD